MRKVIFLIAIVALMAAGASAQEVAPMSAGEYRLETPFDADLGLGYRWVDQRGDPLAGQYEWLHSSAAGKAVIEWDPLPHRFFLDTYVLSPKEYYGEMDYAYKDVVMVNVLSRSLFHNLEHLSLGTDDPTTLSPSSVDFNPADVYGVQNMMNGARIRFKAPEFPFHIYLEARDQEKKGTIQQIFLRSFTGGFDRASQSRDIDYETTEAKATVNSHLDWVELEYSHSEKKFKDATGQVLTDTTSPNFTYTHNLVPSLESSNDTIKLHTNYTGRITASATYSAGDKENKDSGTKATYANTAADLTVAPHRDVMISVRYRHYEMSEDNPPTVTSISPGGLTTYNVRDAISTTRDTVSAFVRYRATQNLTLRAEYAFDALSRDFAPGTWNLDTDVKKNTVRLGATYRLTSRLMLRGDVSYMTASVPANSTDNTYPSMAEEARALLTWNPVIWYSLMLSGSTTREERNPAAFPFAGDRTTDRNRAMTTMTFLLGKRASLTPGYAFYQNRTNGPLAYTDLTGAISSESGVPYADTAHVVSLALGVAISDSVTLTADVSQSHSRGNWQNSGVVPGSTGIAGLTSLKMIENEAGADLSFHYTKNLGTDFRYSYRKIEDQIDGEQNGTNQIALAMLTYKW